MFAQIITAYARDSIGITAIAYVEESEFAGLPPGHTYRVASNRIYGQSRDDCIAQAVKELRDSPRWQGMDLPVIHRGRKSTIAINGLYF